MTSLTLTVAAVPESPAPGTARDRRREEFTRGRAQLAAHVSRTLLSTPAPVIATTDLGRPFVRGSDASVSLSHTAGFTASAVATSAIALGVDVEREDRPLPRQIRPAAADLVIEASLGRRFPDIGTWTARESVGKALGFGLLATWDVYELAGVTALGVDRPVWQVEFRALPFMRSHVWSPCAGAVMALATSTAVELPVVLAAIDALQLTIDDRPALSAT